MMRFETWWGKVLANAEKLQMYDGGPYEKVLAYLARNALTRDADIATKFELDTTQSPWILRLKKSIELHKTCEGGNEKIPEIECHSFAVIPRLSIVLDPDETALAIHALYTGSEVPDLSAVSPNSVRLQDWFIFAAIAEYPPFKNAVVKAWGMTKNVEVNEDVDRRA